MARETLYYKIGKKIGYWFAANRDMLVKQIITGAASKIPIIRWLRRFM